MRLSEAFHIDGAKVEKKIRYVIVGQKTEQSLRRIPLPAGVPAIKGRLFPLKEGQEADKAAHNASKRINVCVGKIGITNPNKVDHSFRHRAQDRLRAAGVPDDIRKALLGHGKKT